MMILSIMDRLTQQVLNMEEELFFTMMERYMKDNLKMITRKDMEYRLL